MSKKVDDTLDAFWDFVLSGQLPYPLSKSKNVLGVILGIIFICAVYIVFRILTR